MKAQSGGQSPSDKEDLTQGGWPGLWYHQLIRVRGGFFRRLRNGSLECGIRG